MTLDRKIVCLVLITAIVVSMNLLMTVDSPPTLRYLFSIIGEIVIILISVSIGLERAKSFTLKSTLGKSLFLISIGILSWGIGNAIWFYYNMALQVEVPYPSLADAGYLGLIPFSAAGLFLLLRSIKITLDKKTLIKLVLLPLAVFILVYWIFISSKLMEDVPLLQKILNVAYPLSDAVFLSFSLVILSMIKGGKLFKPIAIICLGFIFQAIADFSFSWTTSAGTYYSGCWVDAFFALAFFTLGVGMYYTSELKK